MSRSLQCWTYIVNILEAPPASRFNYLHFQTVFRKIWPNKMRKGSFLRNPGSTPGLCLQHSCCKQTIYQISLTLNSNWNLQGVRFSYTVYLIYKGIPTHGRNTQGFVSFPPDAVSFTANKTGVSINKARTQKN